MFDVQDPRAVCMIKYHAKCILAHRDDMVGNQTESIKHARPPELYWFCVHAFLKNNTLKTSQTHNFNSYDKNLILASAPIRIFHPSFMFWIGRKTCDGCSHMDSPLLSFWKYFCPSSSSAYEAENIGGASLEAMTKSQKTTIISPLKKTFFGYYIQFSERTMYFRKCWCVIFRRVKMKVKGWILNWIHDWL